MTMHKLNIWRRKYGRHFWFRFCKYLNSAKRPEGIQANWLKTTLFLIYTFIPKPNYFSPRTFELISILARNQTATYKLKYKHTIFKVISWQMKVTLMQESEKRKSWGNLCLSSLKRLRDLHEKRNSNSRLKKWMSWLPILRANLRNKFSQEYFVLTQLQLGIGIGHDLSGNANPISALFFQTGHIFPVTGKIFHYWKWLFLV